MGLTLAPDSQSVYWVVRSYEGSALFRAPMAGQLQLQPGEVVPSVQVSQLCASMQGPLCYFSQHLLWLQDDRNAVIGDLGGQNAAVITGSSPGTSPGTSECDGGRRNGQHSWGWGRGGRHHCQRGGRQGCCRRG